MKWYRMQWEQVKQLQQLYLTGLKMKNSSADVIIEIVKCKHAKYEQDYRQSMELKRIPLANITIWGFRLTQSQTLTMKHSRMNPHDEDTTSPVNEKTRPPQKSSRSHKLSKKEKFMASAYEMQFPFTTRKEILDWEACYLKDQSERRRDQEQVVIAIKGKVETRKTPETPEGYLSQSELRQMAKWKDRFVPSKIDKNRPGLIEKITGEAFGLDDDWEKMEKLKEIYGVAASVASVILHLYDEKKYPILDVHALRTIGIDNQKANYDEPFWRKYVNFCHTEAKRYNVSMRALDRALYKYSERDAVFVMTVMADETLFLELERRGYDLPSL